MPFSHNGTAYEIYGNRQKPALVFIHGLGLTKDTWNAYIAPLKEDYFIITYDLSGHGKNALPEAQASLKTLSKQLFDLLHHLDIKAAHLIGFSLGGMINRRFAMDYPDKVLSLIILNSPHERDDALQAKVEAQAKASADEGVEAVLEAALQRWFTPDFIMKKPDIVDWVRQTLRANHQGNYAAHRYVLAAGVTELIRPEPALSHPTLIITCENDTGSTPPMSRAIQSEIENSKLLIIDNLQHLGLIEQPALFLSPIKSFLENLS